MIYEVFGNPLLIFAFSLISIFWILVVIGLRFQELRFFRSLTGNGETSLTSLGIFFTFWGFFSPYQILTLVIFKNRYPSY